MYVTKSHLRVAQHKRNVLEGGRGGVSHSKQELRESNDHPERSNQELSPHLSPLLPVTASLSTDQLSAHSQETW